MSNVYRENFSDENYKLELSSTPYRIPIACNSLLRRGFCFFKKQRKRGKGGKKGKAKKGREKGKSEESLCQISVEIWRPPGGWLCTAMPACWAVEQRILKMAFLNVNNPKK